MLISKLFRIVIVVVAICTFLTACGVENKESTDVTTDASFFATESESYVTSEECIETELSVIANEGTVEHINPVSDPTAFANEIIDSLKEDLCLASQIMTFEIGSEFADPIQNREPIEFEVIYDDGSKVSTPFYPLQTPYNTVEKCMEVLHRVFTDEACDARSYYFSEDEETCLIVDGTLYYIACEPPRFQFITPFERAELISENEVLAKTYYVGQDFSKRGAEITFKKENDVWKIDRMYDVDYNEDRAFGWAIDDIA